MLSRDLIGTLLFLAVFTAYGVFAWQIPMLPFEEYEVVTSSTMPKIYAGLGIMVCLCSLAGLLLKQKAVNANKLTEDPKAPSDKSTTQNNEIQANMLWGLKISAIKQTSLLLILMTVYALSLEGLGFILATLLFLGCGFVIMGERRLKVLLLAAVPIVLLFWVLMTQVLGIYLAAGSLWS